MIHALYRTGGALLESLPVPRPPVDARACGVLVHAASAGEVKAARSLRDVAGGDWLIGTGTSSGMGAGADFRTPRDLPRRTARLLEVTRPRLLLLVEAELWPTLLERAAARGLPVAVVGARMSPEAHRRWSRAPRSARASLFGAVRLWAAASSEDAARIVDVGVDPARVVVTGVLKFPAPAGPEAVAERRREASEGSGRGPLFVLGSVHRGEVDRLAALLAGGPLDPRRSRWQVVPRHASAGLRREGERHGARWEPRFGVLRSWYGAADACFVGGGWRGRGVHDLLEAVAAGLRPLFADERGDPAGIGALLVREGLALPAQSPIAALPARVPPPVFERLQSKLDGRRRTLDALRAAGLL